MRVYYDSDCDLKLIQDKKIVIVGYGSQGHAHAQNLRDSGVKDVAIALRPGSATAAKAEGAGFKVLSNAEAAAWADIVMILAPDEHQAAIYAADYHDNMKPGAALAFAHGLNIHFGLIEAREDLDVIMIAPKGPGHMVRRLYQEGKGMPALIAVAQNKSRQARKTALAWAKGIGSTRAGVLETTFKEETETDLFGEQAVLCGGASALVLAGFETLVEAGYQPEMAYFECLHELKLICDLMYESGIAGMRFSISETAKYGDITRGPRVITKKTKADMQKILKEIQTGKFTKEWVNEYKGGLKNYHKLLKAGEKHKIEKTGAYLRGMMPWMAKKNIKGVAASY